MHRPSLGRLISSLLNDPDPVDVVLLSHELFSGNHKLVQVVHDAEGRADSDAKVPLESVRVQGHAIGTGGDTVHVLFVLQKVGSDRRREAVFITFVPRDDVEPVSEPQEPIQQRARCDLWYWSATTKRGGNDT